ncbi:MAG: OsmC family protein [Burkholderiaceae bacterium]
MDDSPPLGPFILPLPAQEPPCPHPLPLPARPASCPTRPAGRSSPPAASIPVCDSPPPLGGPNEAINPVEMLLAALAACGTFVCERAASESGIALHHVSVTSAADFDPRAVCGEPYPAHLQAVRVRLVLEGPNEQQRDQLALAFQTRCPLYSTLARAAPVTLEVTARA